MCLSLPSSQNYSITSMNNTQQNGTESLKRRPYRTKEWWGEYDGQMIQTFPIGARVPCHRGRVYVTVEILGKVQNGMVEVRNILNGKTYNASVECLLPPSEDVLPLPVRPVERKRPVIAGPIAVRLLQHDEDGDRRSNPEYKDRAKLLPLSMDELTAFTALSAINKNPEYPASESR